MHWEIKMLALPLAVVVLISAFGSLAHARDFYVKPSSPSADCPSGETPCYTLQEYVDQHILSTNNSRFIFLKGDHSLDSMLEVSTILNITLVGAGLGVKIVGSSPSAGIKFQVVVGLSMKNLDIANLNISIANGDIVYFDRVTISGGITFENLEETFSIGNSTFLGHVNITFDTFISTTKFHFENNTLSGAVLDLKIACKNIKVQITNSVFENGYLNINLGSHANEVVAISYTIFDNAGMFVENTCRKLCSSNHVKLTRVGTIDSTLQFHGNPLTFISVKKSVLSYASMPFVFKYNDPDTFGKVIFDIVAVVNNTVNSPVISVENALLQIVDSTFENNSQTGLWALNSQLQFDGASIFRNNSGLVGGALQLLGSSQVQMTQSAFISFENNHAEYVGGAIFAHDVNRNTCPFSFDPPVAIKMNFINNTASKGGSSVYGVANDSLCGRNLFDAFNVSNSEADPSAIASDPYNLCLCDDGKRSPNCASDNRQVTVHAFPGEEFSISLAAVSLGLEGVVPGDIRATKIQPQDSMREPYVSQASTNAFCENFKFAMNTTKYGGTFSLTTEKSTLDQVSKDNTDGFEPIEVAVMLLDCPSGFSLSNATGVCVCDPAFHDTDVQCLINNQSFLRPSGTWLGVGELLDEYSILYHPNCPIGYCLLHDVIVTSNTSDSQCESHRGGLLCGQCQDGYSLTLGDGECVTCSNVYVLLILPLAVAGLLLVAALFALNLTVTEGTINGLIFYANVVAMTHNILFSGQTSYLYTFVAWLNLDLGINTCLSNGLDRYTETWLQFVFPVYLWVITLVVMLVFRCFPRLSQRLGGRSMWDVAATLFLLSYTKFQRIVFTVLSFTKLEYSNGDARYVWLYDANLAFFKGKHFFLGLVVILIFIFAILPYTLLLVFNQKLLALSDRKYCGWLNNLKPVLDAYAGAHKDKYHFWTGMLLIVRTLLIIIFTINATGLADLNLLVILVMSLVLLMGHSNTIYSKMPLNYLESFFYLQLGVFAAGMVYALHNHGNITAVADTSFGLTLAVFLGIVAYHVLRRFGLFKTLHYRMKEYADIEDYSIEHERK